MTSRRDGVRDILLFLLRNLVLYFFLVNSYLQLREELNLFFQSSAFLVGLLAALWMEKGRLRFLPALLLASALPAALRAVFFLVFRLQRVLAPGQATDFLFFLFDKDFLPALVVYAVAWSFNFLALRKHGFVFIEIGLNSLLLLMVFWTQAGYHLSLYPHPSILANLLALFVVAELFVILLAESRRISARSLLSFSWLILPLLLVFMFFLLGKYSEGAVKAGGGLMKPTLFRFDFSPFIRLESEIRMSDEEVLLFRTQGRADRWLLKRFVLSGYDPNRGFFLEKGKGVDEYPSTVPDSPQSYPDPRYRDRKEIDQEYFFLTLDPSSLIALDYPMNVTPMKNWKSSSFLRVYRVLSKTPGGGAAARIREAPAMPPGALSYYTKHTEDADIKALALSITEKESGYYAKIKAIESYLKKNYLYSLRPGIAEDGDQLHYFLFDSKKGYCSYFAFAMALMCRSLGIPARVAVGFYVDPAMEVLNFYEVRAFQAHAWVEVYFGDLGWIQFDPTSQTLAPGEQFNFYMGPDKDKLAALIREIMANESSLTEEQAPVLSPAPGVRFAGELAGVIRLLARLWYLTIPLLYLLCLFCLKLLPSLPGLFSSDARGRTRSLYRLCLVLLYGLGATRRPAESHLEYGRRIQGDRGIALPPVTAGYLKAVFADRFDASDFAALLAARRGFLASYRKGVNPALRLLGLLNPLNALGRKS